MAVAGGVSRVRGVVAENILDDFVCPSLVGKRVALALNAAPCLKSVVAKEVGKPVL